MAIPEEPLALVVPVEAEPGGLLRMLITQTPAEGAAAAESVFTAKAAAAVAVRLE
jgi:hypothetical protein